ncbi:unnamed protein product [Enterobius vermicularis]|uniref:Nudix hydrolase domain-containing protein n=1 Tax=Enterobius vermicularis TaxID=51028 RepID=A0A0N4UXT7_ENTVE|nr:unnamed protein product [Enterobius vermicularis]
MSTAQIRKSAVLLLINSKNGKVLLGRRSSSASFMPNTLVFPGGVVDQEDINFSKSCLRNNSENITQVSGKIASVRELFEECGLLPVIKDGKDKSSFNHFSSDCYSSDSASTCLFKFTFFRCVLSASASPYLANTWLTPFDYPKRFDNTFYAMKVSDSPVPRSHKSELSEAKWMVPLETVEGAENGLYILPPPQAYELTRIIEAGRTGLQLEKIEIPTRICPQLVNDKENQIALLNGDQDYIEGERSTITPMRDISEIGPEINPRKLINRIIYKKKPLYSNIKICSSQ